MRRAALALLPLLASPAGASATDDERSAYERSVVRLHVTQQFWDEDRPWAKRKPESRTAAAVLVDARHLLTTAQMVEEATYLRVEVHGRLRVEPRIERIDPSINLALLAVDDPAALEGLEPAVVAERTPTTGTLATVRWSQQQLESAASRVSRFEVERSWGNRTYHAFLHLQSDITGGGWAEPVFDGATLVGLTVSQTRQTSRAIPAEILREFLSRDAYTDPDGAFTTLGVSWQVNRDEAVSRMLGQVGEPRGVLVRQVPWGSTACGVLKPQDILLELGGEPIDAEGFYRHERLGRLNFSHILAERFPPGAALSARVLRDGAERELTLQARPYPASLDRIPSHRDGPPPYVITGGLVLRELDVPYLRTWGEEWAKDAPNQLLRRYYFDQQAQTPAGRRTVLIASVLPAPFNIGYQSLRDEVVVAVNGRPIGKIEDVVEALAAPLDGFHILDLVPEASRGRIVLDATTSDAATAEILAQYHVPAAVQPRTSPLPDGGGECPGEF